MRYCAKCGKPLEDDMAFCGYCGQPVNRKGVVDNQKVIQNQGDKPKKSKLPVIIGIIAGILILLLVLFFAFVFNLGKSLNESLNPQVDLSQYITVTYEGYDGSGRASIKYDSEHLNAEIMEKWNGKSGQPVGDLYSISVLTTNMTGSANPSEGLSNGDEITITVNFNKAYANEFDIEFIGEESKQIVTGLKPTAAGAYDNVPKDSVLYLLGKDDLEYIRNSALELYGKTKNEIEDLYIYSMSDTAEYMGMIMRPDTYYNTSVFEMVDSASVIAIVKGSIYNPNSGITKDCYCAYDYSLEEQGTWRIPFQTARGSLNNKDFQAGSIYYEGEESKMFEDLTQMYKNISDTSTDVTYPYETIGSVPGLDESKILYTWPNLDGSSVALDLRQDKTEEVSPSKAETAEVSLPVANGNVIDCLGKSLTDIMEAYPGGELEQLAEDASYYTSDGSCWFDTVPGETDEQIKNADKLPIRSVDISGPNWNADGVSVEMDIDEAKELLENNGWLFTNTDAYNSYIYYFEKDGMQIKISAPNENIEFITVYESVTG